MLVKMVTYVVIISSPHERTDKKKASKYCEKSNVSVDKEMSQFANRKIDVQSFCHSPF
jgi:hypothetical protein